MTLNEGVPGNVYTVKAIMLSIPIVRRLQILGMTAQATIVLLNKLHSGSVLIRLRGCRYAVGAAFTKGILVQSAGWTAPTFSRFFFL